MALKTTTKCCVWPVHKKVCGERSKPFRWPLLSQKEADDAIGGSLSTDTCTDGSLADRLNKLYSVDLRIIDFIYQLTANHPSELVPELVDHALCIVRHQEQSRLGEPVNSVDSAMRFAAALSFNAFENDRPSPPTARPAGWPKPRAAASGPRTLPAWYDKVHHHIVVFIGVFLHRSEAQHNPATSKAALAELDRLCASAWDAFDKVLQKEVGRTHPEAVQYFWKISIMLKMNRQAAR
ncbi:hypothetical protein JCM8097_007697 [Rhodosporidiobolus ruineniae]